LAESEEVLRPKGIGAAVIMEFFLSAYAFILNDLYKSSALKEG